LTEKQKTKVCSQRFIKIQERNQRDTHKPCRGSSKWVIGWYYGKNCNNFNGWFMQNQIEL